ncbi:spindle and kinetochore-associated protein 1 homolog isoform X2 [Sorghum bicolor]|uniref:spindle and kinetochore-associated protein 1 homolog isoform X2 n=1 Tax=Sorghum bicolor TaxID=4558 RepID=UPI000B426732|nr:spindle and kinetochore-associated protein 1 homolog isoform X2 [Sorghum bicolor]|eukprot:XP_021310672.1 spindle and kinetochore-associated protein 1 homolog isoform X2 [Sorghum bicolor]
MDADDGSRATPPLDATAAAFKSQVMELQDLVLARSMFPATALPELGNVDALVTAMETQVQNIRLRLQEELGAIPKAKGVLYCIHMQKLVQRLLKQEEKLQHMLANLPSGMRKDAFATQLEQSTSKMLPHFDSYFTEANECDVKIKDEPVAAPRGRAPAPRWYISTEELDSLSSYMRGRLTLEKVNIAINEVASYAEANAHLVTCPKRKLSEDTWDKALELRDIAAKEAVKGNHFFLEADIKGPGLKLDHTGKAILTVLRHLGRFQEVRIGHHRVFILSKQA